MSPKKILVVDDEPDLCRYFALLFQEHGYAVSCACDGQEAAFRVKQARPDLIMLDLSMPNKSGLKFYREMRSTAELSRIPVVLVGMPPGTRGSLRDADGSWMAKYQLPPPDGFIAKPIDPDQMIGLVDRLVSERQLEGAK
jgi:CheY-like chemotaxis protein